MTEADHASESKIGKVLDALYDLAVMFSERDRKLSNTDQSSTADNFDRLADILSPHSRQQAQERRFLQD